MTNNIHTLLLLILLSINTTANARKADRIKYSLREVDSLGLLDKSYERDLQAFLNTTLKFPSLSKGMPADIIYESDSFVYYGYYKEYTLNDIKHNLIHKINKQALQKAFLNYNKYTHSDVKQSVSNYIKKNPLFDDMLGHRQIEYGPYYVLNKDYLIAHIQYRTDVDNYKKIVSIIYYLDKNNLSVVSAEQEPYPYTFDYIRNNESTIYVTTDNLESYIKRMKYGCNKKHGGCIAYMFETEDYVYYGYVFNNENQKAVYTYYRTNRDSLMKTIPDYKVITPYTIHNR